MKRIISLRAMQKTGFSLKIRGESAGFVPTMGYLHEGHLSLIRRSQRERPVTVVSIFVNPTQFAPGEDFNRYPRDMRRDFRILRSLGVDYVFTPAPEAMYPEPFSTAVSVEGISRTGEGVSRPAHFRGVCTVVAKLLNIVQPSVLYVGQKDIQQAVILRIMAKELNMPLTVRICPTVREKDGLAMSSRNTYLSAGERASALSLVTALRAGEEAVKRGEKRCDRIIKEMRGVFERYPGVKPDYIICADSANFQPVGTVIPRTVIAVAARVGTTRLIDNTIVSPPGTEGQRR